MNIKTATLSKTMQDRKKSFLAGRNFRNIITYHHCNGNSHIIRTLDIIM